MKILTISCIHNDVESLLNYSDKILELRFDVILCPGDFLDAPIKKIKPIELGKLIVVGLKVFGKPLMVVPGCWDKELIGVFESEGISVHGNGVLIGEFGFYGFGGAKTPFGLPFEPSEEEIERGLTKAYNQVSNARYKVQLTHAPPLNSKLDIISSGAHVGSRSVRNVIERFQPDVAVCSHIHESKGIDKIGRTTVVNAGRFPEGYCSIISIDESQVKAELINLI